MSLENGISWWRFNYFVRTNYWSSQVLKNLSDCNCRCLSSFVSYLSLTPVRNDDMTTMNNSLVIAEFLRTILFVFERLWILFNFRNSILPSCLRRNINFDWKMWATLSARGQVLGNNFYSLIFLYIPHFTNTNEIFHFFANIYLNKAKNFKTMKEI